MVFNNDSISCKYESFQVLHCTQHKNARIDFEQKAFEIIESSTVHRVNIYR